LRELEQKELVLQSEKQERERLQQLVKEMEDRLVQGPKDEANQRQYKEVRKRLQEQVKQKVLRRILLTLGINVGRKGKTRGAAVGPAKELQ